LKIFLQRTRHPLVDSACPILHYADDTLILLRGELQDVCFLKTLLATGLRINFDKSTDVPMNMGEEVLPHAFKLWAAIGKDSHKYI
jgi:hypothetical protein